MKLEKLPQSKFEKRNSAHPDCSSILPTAYRAENRKAKTENRPACVGAAILLLPTAYCPSAYGPPAHCLPKMAENSVDTFLGFL